MADGFRYDIGQTIFFLQDNAVISARILARRRIDRDGDIKSWERREQEVMNSIGYEGVVYATIEGIVHETKAFSTKQELLSSL